MDYHCDSAYQFLSAQSQQLCNEIVRMATRYYAALDSIKYANAKKRLLALIEERDKKIREMNIALLQEHIPHMTDDNIIRRAHQTIAHLRALNGHDVEEAG